MIDLATQFATGVRDTIVRYDLAWSVSQLGARCEYRFANPAPVTGNESATSYDADLEAYLHLACVNRGVLITPFHNMALMCPSTTSEDVAAHQSAFDIAVDALVG
jgi:glutamate-1-semialdehyde 2,1-aminomutase